MFNQLKKMGMALTKEIHVNVNGVFAKLCY